MAQTMSCTVCESAAAILVLTNLGTGDVQSPCADCLPVFAMSLADATGVLQAAREQAVQDYIASQGAGKDPAARKAGGRARKSTAPAPDRPAQAGPKPDGGEPA